MNRVVRKPSIFGTLRPGWVLAALIVLAGSGCMRLGPDPSPKTRFYLLQPLLQVAGASPSAALPDDITVGVGPVDLPTYLHRPQIVTRLSGNRIRVDDFHRWAEPLKGAVVGILTENISLLTGAVRVVGFPWKRSLAVDLQVAVEVSRFDVDTDGTVHLQARWEVLGQSGKRRILERKSAIVRRSAGGYEQMARAMSEALAELSREIGRAIFDALRD